MKTYKTLTPKDYPDLFDDISEVLEDYVFIDHEKWGARGYSAFFVTKKIKNTYKLPPECIGCWYRTDIYTENYNYSGLHEDDMNLHLCERVSMEAFDYKIID